MTTKAVDTKLYRELKKRFEKVVGGDEEVTVLFEEGRWQECAAILEQIAQMQREDFEATVTLADELNQAMKEWADV